MESKEHWEQVYSSKTSNDVSWFQEHAEQSMRLIEATGLNPSAAIIDVGGGASTLVDDLLAGGYSQVSVLDLSGAALKAAQQRLGDAAARVQWLEANITDAPLASNDYDLWHDRAVFHFLTEEDDRRRYVQTVLHALKPGGHVILATFDHDGPTHCSGLPVVRYSADELHAQFGGSFALLEQVKEEHRTPWGTVQKFIYCYCRKWAAAAE